MTEIIQVGPLWEKAAVKGLGLAFWTTLKSLVRDPVRFYGEVAEGKGIARPWIFTTVIYFISFLSVVIYQAGLDTLKSADLFNSIVRLPIALIFIVIGMAITAQVSSIVAVFFQTVIFHLCLIVVGGKTKDVLATARVVCYAGAPNLLLVVPVIGWVAAGIWGMYLVIVGLKIVHETTYGKAAFAVLLPAILCFGSFVLALAMIGGGILAAFLKGGIL